ncbi:hypothetical protein DL89DRAFT_40105 [Linderina pennispora]|uniref:Uncharacterized protein n=1 Tax=Linderina pennispora TaxID=61395 RepID=A0A1Y1W3A0_9FUNG|nr:uncharacterized protein DL89DRAFT_40105 [Linderina pennispora]ORX68019.1 hypothetical protein DL89DRAFT_40105 [Linderina pennispora]
MVEPTIRHTAFLFCCVSHGSGGSWLSFSPPDEHWIPYILVPNSLAKTLKSQPPPPLSCKGIGKSQVLYVIYNSQQRETAAPVKKNDIHWLSRTPRICLPANCTPVIRHPLPNAFSEHPT